MAAATPTLNTIPGQLHRRVLGLDTLRFFLAMWVVFGHLGFFPFEVDQSRLWGKIVTGIHGNLFSGPAAVIVFFVISGFCIHYPFRNDKPLLLIPYFSRRNLRIWIPILVAVLISQPLKFKYSLFGGGILWSLLAEEIYYCIYPFLLNLRRRMGWGKILFVAYIGALLVIATNPRAGNYPSYGPYLNWILGLPCWLLGCCLAEQADHLRSNVAPRGASIWLWRLGAWGLSSFCMMLRFHSPIKYPWTLTLFAVFAFFWLKREIVHAHRHAPMAFFENIGKGSYTIYLVHELGPALYLFLALPLFPKMALWGVHMVFTGALCWAFYQLIEKQSHRLARSVADKLSPKVPAL